MGALMLGLLSQLIAPSEEQLLIGTCGKVGAKSIHVRGLTRTEMSAAFFSWSSTYVAENGVMFGSDVAKVELLNEGVIPAPVAGKLKRQAEFEIQATLTLTLKSGRVLSLTLPYRLWAGVTCVLVPGALWPGDELQPKQR